MQINRMAALLVACVALTVPATASELTEALTADILGTQPGSNRDDNTDGVMLNVVEGLVGYGEGGNVVPVLAKSVDLSKDKLTYTFRLRSGVKFHNGDPMTSADFIWSWKYYMDPAHQWRCRPQVDGEAGLKVTSVETPDPMTVVIKISKPDALFLDTFARTDCWSTAVLNKASFGKDGHWIKPIGTGPYMLEKWIKGQSVTLKKFDQYRSPEGKGYNGYAGNKTPSIDTIKLIVIPDAATAKTALLSGNVDVTQLQVSDIATLKGNSSVGHEVAIDASKNVILFQTAKGVFSNVKLRRAVALALDLPQLVAFASDNAGIPNSSAVFPKSTYYDAVQKEGYKQDIAEAKKLVAESGYDGTPIKLIANQRAPMPSYQVALVTQQMLQAIGLKVEIALTEWATQLDLYRSGNYQMMSFSYSSRLDPASSYEEFSGDKTKEPRKVWDDPKALALINQASIESDKTKRQKMFDDLHKLMLQDTPMIMLYNGITVWGYNRHVHNLSPWEGKPRFWGVRLAD